LPSCQEMTSLIGHKRDVAGISFSPDGRTLATISDDGTVKLWHVRTWRELVRFETPMKDPTSPDVMFSPDGRTLVADVYDGPQSSSRTWYAPSPDEIAVAEGTVENQPGPRDPISWFLRGKALAKHGRTEAALSTFSEVIQQAGERPELEAVRTSALRHRS